MCHACYDKDIWEWFGHSVEIRMLTNVHHNYSKSLAKGQNRQELKQKPFSVVEKFFSVFRVT